MAAWEASAPPSLDHAMPYLRQNPQLGGVMDSAVGVMISPFGFVVAAGLLFAAYKLSQVDTDKLVAGPARKKRRRR